MSSDATPTPATPGEASSERSPVARIDSQAPPAAAPTCVQLPSFKPTLKLSSEVLALGASASPSPSPSPSRSPSPQRAGTIKLLPEQLAAFRRPDAASSASKAAESVPPPVTRTAALATRRSRLLWACAGPAAAVVLLSLGIGHHVRAAQKAWVAPMLLSASDARVTQVATMLQDETAKRSALELRKDELEARLKDTTRWISLEDSFQESFKAALRSDLRAQRAELRRVQALLTEHDATSGSPSADLDTRLAAVRERIRLLELASSDGQGSRYEVLSLRREYDRSVLAGEQARELSAALNKALGEIEDALGKEDALIATIEASPYRRAIAGDASLAFVPYEDGDRVRAGDDLVVCKTLSLACRTVGTVGDLLPSEVHGIGPDGEELRGQLAVLSLSDGDAVKERLLFVRPAVRPSIGSP